MNGNNKQKIARQLADWGRKKDTHKLYYQPAQQPPQFIDRAPDFKYSLVFMKYIVYCFNM